MLTIHFNNAVRVNIVTVLETEVWSVWKGRMTQTFGHTVVKL